MREGDGIEPPELIIKMKIFIKTFGCQANISDSETIAGLLQEGFTLVNSEDEADTIIVNSCAVKNATQSKILDYLKKYSKEKKVFVGGCLTKVLDIKKYAPVKAVFDTNSILKISEILTQEKDAFSDHKESRILAPLIRKDSEVAIIPIGEGCLNSCTFCATKLARGNLRSYRMGDIKRAFEKAVNEGCKKIYLTSQDNGCYGFDLGASLPELLDELTQIKGDYLIRVGMMNPWHLTKILPDLLESYSSDRIMKFLHIPVQSGSERILKHMKRIHTVDNFTSAVNLFRKSFPDISIATDIIIGYPLETEDDFKQTLDLIKKTKPEVLNISKFSSRPGTEASKLKQLSSEIVKERTLRLNSLYQEIRSQNKLIRINNS